MVAGKIAWVFDFVANDGFDNNYQLDGGIETYRSSNVLSGANVFTTQKKSGIDYEVLKAVSVSMSQAADVKYTVLSNVVLEGLIVVVNVSLSRSVNYIVPL